MFHFLSFDKPGDVPSEKRIYGDGELKSLEQNDAYTRKKLFLNYIVFLLLAIITVLSFLFLVEIVRNAEFRTRIVDEISKNLIYIILYAIGILGIKGLTDSGSNSGK